MKFLKNEKWKLEPFIEKVCISTIFIYGFILFLVGLTHISYSFSSIGEIISFDILFSLYVPLRLTFLIYVIPAAIVLFLTGVSFAELTERNNPRVFVHPLVLSAIAISIVGTLLYIDLIESAF